jgi:hypothetical protein
MTRHHLVATGLLIAISTAPEAWAQCHEQQISASNSAELDVFAWSLDLEIDRLVIGAVATDNACPTNPNCNSGSVYVFHKTGGTWTEKVQLVGSDTAFRDQFGHDVGISGDRILVGAHLKDGGGAAYIFAYDGTNWVEEQKLLGSTIQDNWHFGHSVALHGDIAVVGTMRDEHQGFETGSAYVYQRSGGTWIEQDWLIASDAASGDRYGRSSDVEGDYIAIGSHLHDGIGADSGSAYIYERDDNGTPGDVLDDSWPEAAALVPSDTHADMLFGRCVDLSNNVLIVGASQADNNGVMTGAAYIYFRTPGGTWTEVQKLTADDGMDGDRFGISVALDGSYALVGARAADQNGTDSGAVYVFTRTPSGYFQTGKILGIDTAAGDQLGHETGVQVEGTTALIGSRFNGVAAPNGGSAYLFSLDDCLGTSYCDITPNSAGPGAEIRTAGMQSISGNDFTLISTGAIPSKVGLFFYGPNQINIPLGNGRLCVGGVVRLNPPILSDPSGVATRQVDFTTFPAGSGPNPITPGSTWNFQHWFRDPAGGGSGFTLSNGVEVSFIP